MSDVSEETLLDYFSSTGGGSGRVKNADMLKTFKPFIGHADLQLRAKYREEFKLIIDRIAVVKSENGEKYLVLKKKYRQMLHERDAKHPGTDGDGQRHSSPARTPATAQWDTTDASTSSSSPRHQKEQQDEREPDGAAEAVRTVSTVTAPQHPVVLIQEPLAQSNKEDDLDKDSGSKSESEQDEESTGSMGSAAVALDPLEKEWIYSAAGARVPDLSQLLRQDPSLANKKDFTSTALHWAAKHGSEDMAALVADAGADVNTKSHGGYTPLHIAALHGHRHILDLLIGTYGAKENLRDYSGHLAFHYLNIKEPGEGLEEDCEILIPVFQVTQARERNRNRKLVSLFHSKKKWGSAEELAPIEEERTASHQLILPAFRPRKFSR
ncbi:ankyrin repeat domain-containing protein SOWAHB isoform X2 [Larimichthys crocea]|uniref:ankyrin repeat domain-containing protein SOWAHB isoform X2 n=1 Tax=Larimichthys crocea TaxID=215358 RepID=UPI000F5F9B34|nr:ankyrin repeat domain-containing protein SOWAHB isoform X2 [Larimichthys crocea]